MSVPSDTEIKNLTPGAAPPPSSDWFKRFLVGKHPRFTLFRVCVWVVASFVLFRVVFLPIEIVGISMEPTFVEGQIRLVNRLAYRKAEPQRGDVVAVRMKAENVVLLKRIIGLPGEHIRFSVGKIYINGRKYEESYVKNRTHPSWIGRPIDVPKDRYFVIGDNRSMWFRDHFKYLAEKSEILGKVVF